MLVRKLGEERLKKVRLAPSPETWLEIERGKGLADTIVKPLPMCGFFPTPSYFPAPAQCPTIWLNPDTIYLEGASGPIG